jgi:hypothetical protein
MLLERGKRRVDRLHHNLAVNMYRARLDIFAAVIDAWHDATLMASNYSKCVCQDEHAWMERRRH